MVGCRQAERGRTVIGQTRTEDGGRDRGREGRLPGSPSLRTGRAVFSHPALRSIVLPQRGLAFTCMGRCQVEQPMRREKGIRIAVMI